MICDPVMLTLALPWLCTVGYKDNVDNANELFKSAFVDKATRSFRPPELNTMRNVPLDDNDVDVQVCDDDDVFGMVNVGSPSEDIESRISVVFNTTIPSDLANEAFKEWILLKVDWLAWLLNEQKLDEIDKSKGCSSNCIYINENLGNAKFEMLLILAFNKAFTKNMESKDLLTVDNLIASLKSAMDATEVATNIIEYFDLDGNVEDDETNEGM
ncbi:unnamed protein product [Sphagnum tenellum]